MRKICRNCVDYNPEDKTCKIKYHYVRGERVPEVVPPNQSGCSFFFGITQTVRTCDECMDFDAKKSICKCRSTTVLGETRQLVRLPKHAACSVFIKRIK